MVKQMQPGERSLRRFSLKKACLHVLFEHLAKMETDSKLKVASVLGIFAGQFGARYFALVPLEIPTRGPAIKTFGSSSLEKRVPVRAGASFSNMRGPERFYDRTLGWYFGGRQLSTRAPK